MRPLRHHYRTLNDALLMLVPACLLISYTMFSKKSKKDSKYALTQSCPASTSLQQIWHGKSASWKQVIANELVTTRRTFSKLVASNTVQTIAKTEYADEPQIRSPDNLLPKPVALATTPAGSRSRRTDCTNRSCIHAFYFKLPS
ncbi:hypothetical protein AVEN_97499-1 [Araneus ventricosus]|uniref:Uncharacterized protein n=1 Tax=Araneus ventricosus TaxID=182803 RepID=A0A4Y2ALY8_ARAVE|nr:hypothetical protein AVEN_97499-1 [Araneus ventricosus]